VIFLFWLCIEYEGCSYNCNVFRLIDFLLNVLPCTALITAELGLLLCFRAVRAPYGQAHLPEKRTASLLIHQILSGCQCILYANLDSETTAFPSDKTRSIINEHVF
jgi:hypothetical protein